MKLTVAAAAVLFGASATLATPAVKRQDTVNYQIKGFTERKYDGHVINAIFFDILATNGGDLNFECGQYGFDGVAVDKFQEGEIYSCGPNNAFSWSYEPGDTVAKTPGIFHLWQKVSDTKGYQGQASWAELTSCRKGPAGADDLICEIPHSTRITIYLKEQ